MNPEFATHPQSRRDFLRTAAVATAVSMAPSTLRGQAPTAAPRLALGLDSHSRRGMRWKVRPVMEYAAAQQLDAVLFNSLQSFESLEPAYLRQLKDELAAKDLRIYFGVGSISEGSTVFSKAHGSAAELLALGVRVAADVGSPVVTCRIGQFSDRSSRGGIEARIAEVVKVLQAVRNRALDAGVKFAFEDHAGDLRSEELLQLIQAAGTDVTGVMLDPGNAVWAMEDPMRQLELLGPHVLCSSVRDWMVWETSEGATMQWTAIGDGLMDVPAFVGQFAKLCPAAPLHLEIISNSPRPIPFLTREHWKVYPNLKAAGIVDFLALCRRGHPLTVAKPPVGADPKAWEQENQRTEFERSVAYLRQHAPVGRRA